MGESLGAAGPWLALGGPWAGDRHAMGGRRARAMGEAWAKPAWASQPGMGWAWAGPGLGLGWAWAGPGLGLGGLEGSP
eukprot:8691504-Alexandrium_andersonii.AAC.1